MSKLQRIQNSAARLVCSTPRFNHITPVLFSLHWLPVAYRIEFKILVLTFNRISTCAVLHGPCGFRPFDFYSKLKIENQKFTIVIFNV